MNILDRRNFLRLAAAGAAGATVVGTPGFGLTPATTTQTVSSCNMPGQDQQAQREEVEAFCRSYYDARDMLDIDRFMAHWADTAISEDVVFNGNGPCNA